MMFLVKLIDVFVGVLLFLFKGERRNNPSIPLALGAIGTAALLAVMLVSIGVPRVAYHARTDAYAAELANAAGLTSGDPVYVAGVPAGRVEAVDLAGDHVRVDFRLDRAQPLGNQTSATIRLRTVLGKRYLDIMPAGAFDAADSHVIPLARTTVPYTLDDVGRKAAVAADGIETRQLADAMRTVTDSLPEDNTDLTRALAGISAASAVFAHSGDKIDELLRISRSLSDLMARQTDTLAATADDVGHIVSALAARRQTLGQLIGRLTALLHELSTVYTAKQEDFGAVVAGLARVTETLRRNAGQVDAILTRMPPAIRAVVNATGNGNWADVNSPSLVLPDNLLCALNVQRECS